MRYLMKTAPSFVIIAFLLLITSCTGSKKVDASNAQVAETSNTEEGRQSEIEDRMPYPIGGLEAIYRNIRYPESCRRARAQGRVVVQLIIDPDGSARDYSIVVGIHEACDREAIRVVRQAKWAPGIKDGVPITVQYQLPIVFRLM